MARDSRRGSFRGKVSHNSQQQKARGASYGHLILPKGIQVFKEEPGSRVTLDILPYVVTDDRHPDRNDEYEIAVKDKFWYRRPYKLHRNVGSGNASVICPTSVGKKCPICEHRKHLLDKEGANWKDEDVKALSPRDRNLYYVQPKDEKKLEDRPYIWDISQFCFQDVLNDELSENPDYEEFPDLENGYTLKIRFSEEKMGKNTYAKTSRIDFEDRNYKYDERDIEELTSLDDVLDFKTYEEIKALFFEVGDGAADDADGRTAAGRPGSGETRSDRGGGDEPDDRDARRTRSAGHEGHTSRDRSEPERETRSSRRSEPQEEPERETRSSRRDRDEKPEEERDPRSARRTARDEKPKEADKPKEEPRSARGADKEPSAAKAPAGECPHGHAFGKDNDKFGTDCDNCPVWAPCLEAGEAAT
jgi:hypothetical protein